MATYLDRLKAGYHRFVDIRKTGDLFGHYIWTHGNTAGIGLHDPSQRVKRIAFRCLTCVFALQQYILVRDVVRAIRADDDDLAIRIGMFVIYSALSLLQMISLDRNYGLFLQVRKYFNSRLRRHCGGSQAEAIRGDLFRQSRRNILVAEIPVVAMSLAWAIWAREEYFHLVLDVGEDYQWIVDFVDQFYGLPLVFWNNSMWIISLTMLSLLQNAVHELTVIARSFAATFDQAMVESNEGQLPDHFWRAFDTSFKASLAEYEQFLAMIATLRALMSTFFLLKVLTVESLLAVTCFMTFKVTFQLITASSYAIVFTVECYIFCNLVEQLNDQREAIVECCQHWRWPFPAEKPARLRHVRTMVLITEAHCQQPVRFRCGEMLDVSMEMFRMVLDTCYTLITFLQATKPAQ